MKMFKYKLMLLVMMSVAINFTWAAEPFRIVTDPWPPYVYLKDGKAVGIDVDIALAVLTKMGIKAKIEMLPWKRSLAAVRDLEADAILSAAITDQRKMFLYFPAEPVSKGETVFFQRKSRNIIVSSLDDFRGLKVGAILGYQYCDELDSSAVLSDASRVVTLDQSFNMLMSDRIDVVVESEAAGMYKAKEMGVSDKISVVEGSRYCSVGNHLAFSKKLGSKELAEKFSKELVRFKATNEYEKILEKYGVQVH